MNTSDFAQRREKMVWQQLLAKERGIQDPRVIEAMRKVPRHLFVPENLREMAYEDRPLPIGGGQTISQPFMVAYMTEVLQLQGTEKILEIGTGSGYQTAVLAEVAKEIYSIEIVPELYEKARITLQELDYQNIHLKLGDGFSGWPEAAPFDAVLVTCAPADVPSPLKRQLKTGGKMIIPLGIAGGSQELIFLTKDSEGELYQEEVMAVRFVPMTGQAEE